MRSKSGGKLRFNRLCSIILIAMMILSGLVIVATENVAALQDGDYTYTVSDGKATITDYTGAGGDITIPSSLGGYSTMVINDFAFSGCTSLTSITIPDSVTSIGLEAFSACFSMTSIEVSPDNPSYASVDGVLFNKGLTELVQCPGGKIGNYTIPDSVTSIGDYAFYQCTSLTSIIIPDSVTSIGDFAFPGCTSLTSVTIGNNVTSIGVSAFRLCTSLTSVTIGNNVTSIGAISFDGCTSLTSIIIPDSVTSIGDYAFYQCTSLTFINVSPSNPSYTSVEGVLFNKALTTLIQYPGGKIGFFTIPDSVTILGNGSFTDCRFLTSIIIPDSVTSIGDYAFLGCTSLNSIEFLSIASPNDVGEYWIFGTPSIIRGHAYETSNFPAPGSTFYGLLMGGYLDPFLPSAPVGLTATGGVNQITLNWNAPVDDGGGNIDYYVIYQDGVELANHPIGLKTTITGLNYNQSYSFTVAAHNFAGLGNRSNQATAITTNVPYAPTGLVAVPGNGQITLSWNEPAFNGGAPIDYYVIYQDNVRVNETTTNLSIIISGLVNGQAYSFSVAAQSEVGIGKVSEPIIATPTETIPTAPLNVTAYAIDGAIIIEWSEPMDNGGSILTSFSISRAENNESIIMLASVNPSVYRYIDNTVVPGSSYSYYIRAINEPGESDYSDGSSPIIAYSLVQLDVGSDSSVSGLGIINILMGSISLVSNQQPVAGLEINLAYSVNDGIDWVALPTVVSSSDGSFNKSWIPTAEGVYLIKALWVGNNQYPSAEFVFSLAITISAGNDIFTVQSNSVISNLIFNSETKQLSFTVSGESGTSGYTRIVVSKELVANGSDIIVTLDGADMNYELSSTEVSWVLYFTYSHSSHDVVADLNSESELISPVNDHDAMLMIGAGLVVAMVLMLLAFVFYRRRR